jgi:hypothetical protein
MEVFIMKIIQLTVLFGCAICMVLSIFEWNSGWRLRCSLGWGAATLAWFQLLIK